MLPSLLHFELLFYSICPLDNLWRVTYTKTELFETQRDMQSINLHGWVKKSLFIEQYFCDILLPHNSLNNYNTLNFSQKTDRPLFWIRTPQTHL